MQIMCALDPEVYNAPNAVPFGICAGHFAKAFYGQGFGHRIVHLSIALFEAIPLIGQIAALFEKILVESCNRKSASNEVCQRVEAFYEEAVNGKSFVLDSSDKEYLRQQPIFKALRDKIKRSADCSYPSEIVRKIKELASCPELIEAREALKAGKAPQLLSGGISGSYILLGRKGQKLGIFKPREQEPGAAGNPKGFAHLGQKGLFGVTPGTGFLRERVAYLLDKKSHFSGVPLTKITQIESKYFPSKSGVPADKAAFEGSFQKWIADAHPAYNDYQILPRWLSSANGDAIPSGQIHKIAILDVRTLNCDRHLENFLVDASLQKVFPIDHGYICPGNAESLRFDWINFPQAKVPFSQAALNYIEQLDPEADAELVQGKIPNVSEDMLKRLQIATRLLQIAAKKGLTAYQIADLFMRRKHEGLLHIINKFVPIPSTTPSYFEKNIWNEARSKRNVDLKLFLAKEVDLYLAQTS
jgi:hypothetical protein